MFSDTILYKFLKWIVASSVSLLAIPITLFIVIISLYPDLTTVNNFKVYKLKSYYDICDTSIKSLDIVDGNSFLLKEQATKKNSIHHLLFIDRTWSTDLKTTEFSNLKKHLIKELNKTIQSIDTNDIKKMIYQVLINSCKIHCDSLHIFFYSGRHYKYKNSYKEYDDSIKYYPPSEAYCIPASRGPTSDINDPKVRTNFAYIFDTIAKFLNHSRTIEIDCITIFSDFFHCDTINRLGQKMEVYGGDIENFRHSTGNTKLHLIALWKKEHSVYRKNKQEQLVNLINGHFVGISKTNFIFTDKYDNSNYWVNSNKFLEFEELFANVNFEQEETKIQLYAPISNNLKYNEATCKIMKDSVIGKFQWKIKKLNPHENYSFWKYDKDCKKVNKRYFMNQWYEEECDSLYLSIKLEHDTKIDDLRFIYTFKDKYGNNCFYEYGFEIKDVIFPNKYQEHLKHIFNFFCFLLIIIIICGEILIAIQLFNFNNFLWIKTKIKQQWRKKMIIGD